MDLLDLIEVIVKEADQTRYIEHETKFSAKTMGTVKGQLAEAPARSILVCSKEMIMNTNPFNHSRKQTL